MTSTCDSFLKEWPVARLRRVTLPEYTAIGQDHTFTAWIERRLDKTGSIWGGSSFKFGIYSRKDKTAKAGGESASYSEDYAWYTKYLPQGWKPTTPAASPHTASGRPRIIDLVVEFADEHRAVAFEKYLKSRSGCAFAQRHFR